MTEVPTVSDAGPLAARWWAPISEFAIHSVVGTLIFAVIAVPAVLLDLLHENLWTESLVIRIGLRIGEYSLFCLDLALFLLFLARAAWRTAVKLWRA